MVSKKIKDLKEIDFKNFLVWDIYNIDNILNNFYDLEVKPYFFDANTEILTTKIQDVIDAYFLVKSQISYILNKKRYIKNGFILISDLIFNKNTDFKSLTPCIFNKNSIKKIDTLFLKKINNIKINIDFKIYPHFNNYFIFYLKDIKHTKNLAENIFNLLKKNIINFSYFSILLTGDLGAGKTAFIKSIIPTTNSPTFNIMNKFKLDDLNIIHWDLYRLENYDYNNLEKELDFNYYLQNKNTINLIEWANRIPLEFYIKNINKNNFIIINLEYISQNERILTLHFSNPIFNQLLS
ncbi:MAG: tRNA (adenosine(37)-N6)-threonylcarbamoyltransferase complex ATPase subunit type 1 TsaE [bacterium]|nr:tRNA (adenosine(37)-N6)-threonylcarbamoyltransferase complex ATPase subunit type 1 TsaE [bacterium]